VVGRKRPSTEEIIARVTVMSEMLQDLVDDLRSDAEHAEKDERIHE
jgi:hypothetical protein